MAQTELQGFPIPDPGVSNDVPADLLELGNAIEKTVIQRYATLAARNAANPNPDDGEVCYVESEKAYYVRLNGTWTIAHSDTGWVNCTPVASGFTGFCRARRVGMQVEVRFDYTTIPSAGNGAYYGLANLPSGIPSPGMTARGMGFVSNGPVQAYVSTAGVVSFVNTSSSARTAVSGTVLYLAG